MPGRLLLSSRFFDEEMIRIKVDALRLHHVGRYRGSRRVERYRPKIRIIAPHVENIVETRSVCVRLCSDIGKAAIETLCDNFISRLPHTINPLFVEGATNTNNAIAL